MPNYSLEFRVYDEHEDEVLTASAPPMRAEHDEGPEHSSVDFRSLFEIVRMMKEQKDHGGGAWWEFKMNPESAKADTISKMVRLISKQVDGEIG